MKIYFSFRHVFLTRIVHWRLGASAIMAPMEESAIPPIRIWVSMDLNHQISQTHQNLRTGTSFHRINQLVWPIIVTICK